MSLLDKTLYGRVTTNSGTIDLGHAPLATLILRLRGQADRIEARGITSGRFEFSVNTFKKEAESGEDPNDINVMMRRLMAAEGRAPEIETEEHRRLYAANAAKQAHPAYITWSRGSAKFGGEKYRTNLGPDEWSRVREIAKELWPDEYEDRKHYFNG